MALRSGARGTVAVELEQVVAMLDAVVLRARFRLDGFAVINSLADGPT